MSKTKHQVFVSSTYSDLREERDAITKALYQMSCIPVGMEAFPAADEEQFNFIKRIIDDTDYYVIIIGARYGSVSNDGIGYTEKEYLYAVEKGVPILAFVHSDPGSIDKSKSDLGDAAIAEKFYRFRNQVTESRLVQMWNDSSTLPAFVVLALNQAFVDRPRTGWTRGSTLDHEEVLSKLVDTQSRLESAEAELRQIKSLQAEIRDVADLSVSIRVTIKTWYRNPQATTVPDEPIEMEVTLESLFSTLGPNIIEPLNQDSVSNILAVTATEGKRPRNALPNKYMMERESLNTIRLQLEALGLIRVQRAQAVSQNIYNYWSLTDAGLREVKRLRVITSE